MLHRMMFRGLIGEIASLGRVTMRYVRMLSPPFRGRQPRGVLRLRDDDGPHARGARRPWCDVGLLYAP